MALHLNPKKDKRFVRYLTAAITEQEGAPLPREKGPTLEQLTGAALTILLTNGWRCAGFNSKTGERTLVGPAGEVREVSAREMVAMAEGMR